MSTPHTNGVTATSGKGVNPAKKKRLPPKPKQIVNHAMVLLILYRRKINNLLLKEHCLYFSYKLLAVYLHQTIFFPMVT